MSATANFGDAHIYAFFFNLQFQIFLFWQFFHQSLTSKLNRPGIQSSKCSIGSFPFNESAPNPIHSISPKVPFLRLFKADLLKTMSRPVFSSPPIICLHNSQVKLQWTETSMQCNVSLLVLHCKINIVQCIPVYSS